MEHLLGPLRPVVELTAVIPAAILCLLPMKGHLRVSRRFLALRGFPLLLVWAVLGGLICWNLHWGSNLWLFPWLAVFGPVLCRMASLPRWKSVSVMLSSCAVFSFMGNLAILADALLDRSNPGPWYTIPGAVIYAGLCWLLLLCLWHPVGADHRRALPRRRPLRMARRRLPRLRPAQSVEAARFVRDAGFAQDAKHLV